MKVLQINCTYDRGSTGRLTACIHRALPASGEESVVCCGRGEPVRETGVHKCCTELYGKAQGLRARLTGMKYGGCLLSTAALIGFIRREKPDVVHLQCINGNFVNIWRLVSWLKERRIKTVLTLHAEFMFTANCSHAMDCERWRRGCGHCPRLREATGALLDRTARAWEKMAAAFRGFQEDCTVVSVSPWLGQRALGSPMFEGFRHEVIGNGVDTDVFSPRPVCSAGNGRPVVLHVTPRFSLEPDHPKGGCYVAELAKRMPHADFVVAGEYGRVPKLPGNVKLLGSVDDPDRLAEWYSRADVTLLTSRRETFSLVCAESLCCGTPVAGFQAGGPETVALPEYSDFVPWGDLDSLQTAVEEGLSRPAADREKIAAAARAAYDKSHMTGRYIALYKELCHGEEC